jgi:hypothetical protein
MQRWRRRWNAAALCPGPDAHADRHRGRDGRPDGEAIEHRDRLDPDAHAVVRLRGTDSDPLGVGYGRRAGYGDAYGATLGNALYADAGGDGDGDAGPDAESDSDPDANPDSGADGDAASDTFTDTDAGSERERDVQ